MHKADKALKAPLASKVYLKNMIQAAVMAEIMRVWKKEKKKLNLPNLMVKIVKKRVLRDTET